MKRLMITCTLFAASLQLHAQTTSGKIFFNETHKLNIDLKTTDIQVDGISADQIASFIPKETKQSRVLYFTPDATLYTTLAKENRDINHADDNMQIMIQVATDDNKAYRDIKNNKIIEQQEFMSRKFLITSDIKKMDWKMTGEQKEILGFACQKATAMNDTLPVTAWFTPAIPVSAGPMHYGGLPGMILHLEVGKNLAFAATKVEPGTVEEKLMKKPNEGKKVTRDEYNKIVREKMKEMQAENGSGGQNIIIKTEVRH